MDEKPDNAEPAKSPPSNQSDHLPRGRIFSDDLSGLPTSEPLNPVKTGCLVLGGFHLGCSLLALLLIAVVVILIRLGAFK